MPSGKDGNGGRRSGSTTKKNAFCSFCRKSYRDVGPLVEGPGDVYICGECIDLCQSILDQEQKRRGSTKQLFNKIPTPREMVARLDEYVIEQRDANLQSAVDDVRVGKDQAILLEYHARAGALASGRLNLDLHHRP